MQFNDLQLNTLYFMMYTTDDFWFINEFYSRPSKTLITGECIKSSWPYASDSVILTPLDTERVAICIPVETANLDVLHKLHPHLFI